MHLSIHMAIIWTQNHDSSKTNKSKGCHEENGELDVSPAASKKTRSRLSMASRRVPGVGIEPTLLAEREFESRASTNSATRA